MKLLHLAFVAGPLLGWGLDAVATFTASPVRLGVVLIAATSYAVQMHDQGLGSPFARGQVTHSRVSAGLLILGVLSVPVLLGWFAYADRRDLLVVKENAAVRVVGLALYALGELVRIVSLRALGKQYSAYVTIQPEHALVRSGIYRFLRHPFYLGNILAIPGIALAFRSVLAGPILVLSVWFVARRIPREEELLARSFPGEWQDYRHATWRLVPFVY